MEKTSVRIAALIAATLILLAYCTFASRPAVAQTNCGSDRPDVQTLTDPNAGDIDTNQLVGINLSTLAALPIPEGLAADTRFNPYETTVWATVGDLVQAQLDASGAIDVTLRDPASGDTLTAVFPDATRCAGGADPALMQLMLQARQSFIQAFGSPLVSGALPLSGEAEVAGIGFIPSGRAASQGGTGSGIELSPVLAFLPIVPQQPSATPTIPPQATPIPTATPPAGGG
jgi:hypothetical protein